METNDKILSIVRERGPVLPVQVSKEISDNILITSARLSELLTAKKIKISNLKIGGSPLYYFPGQESKLQNYLENLNGTEKKAYDLLLQNKILKDSDQEPAVRVALRQIKDFAVPLQVSYNNKTEIFWKWYLVSGIVAETSIRGILSKNTPSGNSQERIKNETTKLLEPKKELTKPLETKKEIIKKDILPIDKGKFIKNIHNYLNSNKIRIIEKKEVKKNTEFDFIIELQSSIGPTKYFCKSKNKKKISDADLSSAVIQAQSKNLPLLFLTSGILTKKSQEMFNKEFENIAFRKI